MNTAKDKCDPIIEVYEKYKHLDYLLADKDWVGGGKHQATITRDLWAAIKDYAEISHDLWTAVKDYAEVKSNE